MFKAWSDKAKGRIRQNRKEYERTEIMAYKQELWDEAKKKCHLGDEEIRMAKEMGLNPKSLIKNIPNKKEMWKAPVKDWIHEMYEDRQRKAERKAKRKSQNAVQMKTDK